jgi:hypothetical protein
MKTKLLILMSMVLLSTVSLISCKENVETFPEKKLSEPPIPETFTEKRLYEPPFSPGAPGFPTGDGGDGTGRSGSGGGGGGTSGGSSVPTGIYTVVSYDIKVGVLPPCIKFPVIDILKKIRNIDSNLDGVLTKFSNNGNTFNYSIRKTNSLNMSNLYAQSPNTPAFTGLTTNGDWVTYLNEDILTGSSQEYIGSVLLHEIYHIKVFQDGHQNDYGKQSYYFTSNYITNIKDDLLQLYGTQFFDSNAALGLALGGVTDGGSTSIYGMTLQQVRNTVSSYQTNDKGTTKCGAD